MKGTRSTPRSLDQHILTYGAATPPSAFPRVLLLNWAGCLLHRRPASRAETSSPENLLDIHTKQAEIEAQIAELSQKYREVQAFMQQTGDRIIYLQGQLALLQELQKPTETPSDL